jgi:hypothetical protein
MSTLEILDRLKHLTNPERLAVIETASRLIREELTSPTGESGDQEQRLRTAALAVKELYEPGGELTEWTALDTEDFVDDPLSR